MHNLWITFFKNQTICKIKMWKTCGNLVDNFILFFCLGFTCQKYTSFLYRNMIVLICIVFSSHLYSTIQCIVVWGDSTVFLYSSFRRGGAIKFTRNLSFSKVVQERGGKVSYIQGRKFTRERR